MIDANDRRAREYRVAKRMEPAVPSRSASVRVRSSRDNVDERDASSDRTPIDTRPMSFNPEKRRRMPTAAVTIPQHSPAAQLLAAFDQVVMFERLMIAQIDKTKRAFDPTAPRPRIRCPAVRRAAEARRRLFGYAALARYDTLHGIDVCAAHSRCAASITTRHGDRRCGMRSGAAIARLWHYSTGCPACDARPVSFHSALPACSVALRLRSG
ncbi:hypothetical protein [Burkholderia latens]|uniref:hypothetical protein n=1 Tax=Burkholderia latens TaxID=488446 RepID=UPI0039A4754A